MTASTRSLSPATKYNFALSHPRNYDKLRHREAATHILRQRYALTKMSSLQKGYPLPPPPTGQQQQQQQYQQYQLPEQRPEQRQRSKSSFSLRSDRSHKSSGSVGKADLHETSQEKASRRLSLSTKADPRLAMQEAEPCEPIAGRSSCPTD